VGIFKLIVVSIIGLIVTALIAQAMWGYFIPKFFPGAVKEGLIEEEVPFGVFFRLEGITLVLTIVGVFLPGLFVYLVTPRRRRRRR